MRLDDWEDRLHAVIERHRALPAKFGSSDCYMIADDAFEAVTGARLYPDAIGYRSEVGAAKRLRAHGFETVADAFSARLPEIAVLQAGRGDLAVVERDGILSGGVVTSAGFVTRGADQLEFLPLSALHRAFKVD